MILIKKGLIIGIEVKDTSFVFERGKRAVVKIADIEKEIITLEVMVSDISELPNNTIISMEILDGFFGNFNISEMGEIKKPKVEETDEDNKKWEKALILNMMHIAVDTDDKEWFKELGEKLKYAENN